MNDRCGNIIAAGIATLACVVGFASTSSAAEFHSSTTATTITGAQSTQHTLSVTSGQVKCTTATFSGSTSSKTSTSITVTPVYKNCKAFGLTAPVDTNGCAFIFTNTGASTVTADVECTGFAKYIAVTAPGCEVRVGPQTGLGTITLSNIAAGDISAVINVSNIAFDEVGASCAGAGPHTTGTYTGTAVFNGDDTSSDISYS